MELCFNRISSEPSDAEEEHPFSVELETYSQSYDEVRCLLMQGGQGE